MQGIAPVLGTAASTSASGVQGLMAQLDRLEQLRASGALTQAEFDAAKARLLGMASGPFAAPVHAQVVSSDATYQGQPIAVATAIPIGGTTVGAGGAPQVVQGVPVQGMPVP